MAEVCPKESIMSLITAKPEKRKTRKRAKRVEMGSLEEEESITCLKLPRNSVEMDEENEYFRCLESSNSQDTKSETEITTEEDESAIRAADEGEEKPNLKRRKESLHKGLVDGDRFLKKLKISSNAKDEENED